MESAVQHKAPRRIAEHMLRINMRLPTEIADNILDRVYPPLTATVMMNKQLPVVRTAAQPPYFTPPANGTSPFMKLPTEVRKMIFAESLPSKYELIHPMCEDEKHEVSNDWPGFVRRNRTSDLMTLNKTIQDEIALVVYEERTFTVHVHEGLKNGGIEFLHAGRQPLHFQDSISDGRFWKFSQSDSDKSFGFSRMKKIRIQIFPSQDQSCKHAAINTYFTTLALVRMLERNCESQNRITSLTIEFMKGKATGTEKGRAAIQRAEQYWWDPNKNKPRETSIHDLPNIELILRPFANLTGCHNVHIEMPDHIYDYARIAVFVRDLKATMKSFNGTMFADDDLERKIESARWAMEDYVFSVKHGFSHRGVEYLSEAEAQEAGPQPMDLDSDDERNGMARSRKKNKKKRDMSPVKRVLSPGSKADSPGSDSKRSKNEEKMAAWQRLANESRDGSVYNSIEEDEAFARAIEASERFADRPEDEDEEDKQMQQAIAASIADLTRRDIPNTRARQPANRYDEGASASAIDHSGFVG